MGGAYGFWFSEAVRNRMLVVCLAKERNLYSVSPVKKAEGFSVFGRILGNDEACSLKYSEPRRGVPGI